MKCSIIALGNSLRGYDFNKIEGFKITLNNGYKYVPYDMCVWFDPPSKYMDAKDYELLKDEIETLHQWGGRWIKSNERKLQRDGVHVANFNSSLILAVNIALNLGYKEIDIYGADWTAERYVHFYDTEPTDPKVLKQQISIYNCIKAMWNQLEFLEDEKVNFITI